MNFFFEFIGYPGSGKTNLSKKIKKLLLRENISLLKSDEYFFKYYPKNKLNTFFLKKYYSYKVKKKFKSNFLFKKEYIFLKKKIQLIIKKNKLNNALKKYKFILEQTNLNSQGKIRSLDNFQIDLSSYYLKKLKKSSVIYNDEGLLQKVYQDYNYNLSLPYLKKKIAGYLNSIPFPNLVLSINTNFKLSLKRSITRNEGFKYFNSNFNEAEKNFKEINKLVKKILKKKKIKILNIKDNKLTKNDILNIKKEILKNI